MTARRRAFVPALVALWATLGSQQALASAPACDAPLLEADPAIVAQFPQLLEHVRGELARPDVDHCARVELRIDEPRFVRVSVTLPDGRAANRTAHHPEDILPTLQALLLVPAAPPQLDAPSSSKPAPLARRRSPSPSLPPSTADRVLPPELEPTPRSLGFELSLVGGPRLGENQLAIGLGALSFVEVRGWLVGFQGRVDRYQAVPSGDPEMGLELAALAGRRLHFRSFALDLNAGPAVAMKGLAFSRTVAVRVDGDTMPPPEPPHVPDDPSTGPVPRLLFGARAGFTPRDVLRSFAGIEASLGPARAAGVENPTSARFPIFALGLVLGGTVGTR